MLAANAFYDVADINGLSSTMEDRAKVSLSGFAMLAAASLLLLTMDSVLAWEDRNKDHTPETGGRAAAPKEGTTKETSTVSDAVQLAVAGLPYAKRQPRAAPSHVLLSCRCSMSSASEVARSL
eukprot:TRINITY_DN7191_c0_g1_i1.p2 TRINITY_DN7191_c0_g1~~TRINITY_DN7191_c0_g1_i1.p2  ORF type:complete len:123 (-),score=12.47 TRINITY_DN7191_c0_g1_i1:385-753(-)